MNRNFRDDYIPVSGESQAHVLSMSRVGKTCKFRQEAERDAFGGRHKRRAQTLNHSDWVKT